MNNKDIPGYHAWINMKQRCYNKNSKSYPNYGGRGIKVCERWLESFENFIEDMGPKPYHNYSLNRIDNDGDYTPNNCEWVDNYSQARNKRNNRLFEYNGRMVTVGELSELTGVNVRTLKARLTTYGMSVKEATTRSSERSKKYHYKGEYLTLVELQELCNCGLSINTIRYRIQVLDWSAEKAINTIKNDGLRIPVTILGIQYDSIKSACSELSMCSKTLRERIESDDYPEWKLS